MHLRILIVEDEQIVAADHNNKLHIIGHHIIKKKTSGEEAVALAEQLRPQLVLMDVQLQGSMDGVEAARLIRSVAGVPVIFITAFAEIFSKNPSLMHPLGQCLSKPFSMAQLRKVLDTVLETQCSG